MTGSRQAMGVVGHGLGSALLALIFTHVFYSWEWFGQNVNKLHPFGIRGLIWIWIFSFSREKVLATVGHVSYCHSGQSAVAAPPGTRHSNLCPKLRLAHSAFKWTHLEAEGGLQRVTVFTHGRMGEAADLLRSSCVVRSLSAPFFSGWGQAGDSHSDSNLRWGSFSKFLPLFLPRPHLLPSSFSCTVGLAYPRGSWWDSHLACL